MAYKRPYWTGNEALVLEGKDLPYTMIDYWRLNLSDILLNMNRGGEMSKQGELLHERCGTCNDENRVLMACELAQKDGSQLVSVGAASKAEIFIVKIWKILVDTSLPLWSCLTGLIYGL